MPDRGEQATREAAEGKIAALFEHATLVAQLRAAVSRRPQLQNESDEPLPADESLGVEANEPDMVDTTLVAGIAERLGRKPPQIAEERADPASDAVESPPTDGPWTFSKVLERLIVLIGLAKLTQTWRLRKAPR